MQKRLPPLILLTSPARSGKDEVAKILVRDYGYVHLKFGTKLQELMLRINPIIAVTPEGKPLYYADELARLSYEGLKKEYGDAIRNLLVGLGDGAREVISEDIWQNKVLNANLPPLAVISDCRYASEARAGRAWGGVVWGISRPGVSAANKTEGSSLVLITPDLMIQNDGTLQALSQKVHAALE